jgi:hypothetical protein
MVMLWKDSVKNLQTIQKNLQIQCSLYHLQMVFFTEIEKTIPLHFI